MATVWCFVLFTCHRQTCFLCQLDPFVSSVWYVVQGFVVHTLCAIKLMFLSFTWSFMDWSPWKLDFKYFTLIGNRKVWKPDTHIVRHLIICFSLKYLTSPFFTLGKHQASEQSIDKHTNTEIPQTLSTLAGKYSLLSPSLLRSRLRICQGLLTFQPRYILIIFAQNASLHRNVLTAFPVISLESHRGVCCVVLAHLEPQNTRSPFSVEGTALAQITKYIVREGRVRAALLCSSAVPVRHSQLLW